MLVSLFSKWYWRLGRKATPGAPEPTGRTSAPVTTLDSPVRKPKSSSRFLYLCGSLSGFFYRKTPLVGNQVRWVVVLFCYVNDPSAGSPTETLLRLLLPLNEQICKILIASSTRKLHLQSPNDSSIHPIGRSDGRCVQRAGT